SVPPCLCGCLRIPIGDEPMSETSTPTTTDRAKKAGGLAGVVAGKTAVSTVGKAGVGLTYRGYSIQDLAEHATFEEVAYLLLYGELPNAEQLDELHKRLQAAAQVPAPIIDAVRHFPATALPMDVLRSAASMLSHWDPEVSDNS